MLHLTGAPEACHLALQMTVGLLQLPSVCLPRRGFVLGPV